MPKRGRGGDDSRSIQAAARRGCGEMGRVVPKVDISHSAQAGGCSYALYAPPVSSPVCTSSHHCIISYTSPPSEDGTRLARPPFLPYVFALMPPRTGMKAEMSCAPPSFWDEGA